jgi:hypothetical protein
MIGRSTRRPARSKAFIIGSYKVFDGWTLKAELTFVKVTAEALIAS